MIDREHMMLNIIIRYGHEVDETIEFCKIASNLNIKDDDVYNIYRSLMSNRMVELAE